MDLAAKRSAGRWEKAVMRLGCVLVSLALLVSLVVQPPKAKAFALTTGTVAALSGAFLAACGLAPVVSGMSSSGEVSESLARLLQDFLDEKHPGVKDAVEWIGAAALTVTGTGKVMIPKSMAEKLGQFAAWVASKFGTKTGINEVYDQSGYFFSTGERLEGGIVRGYTLLPCLDTVSRFYLGMTYVVNGHSVFFSREDGWLVDGNKIVGVVDDPSLSFITFCPSVRGVSGTVTIYDTRFDLVGWKEDATDSSGYVFRTASPNYSLEQIFGSATSESLALDIAESMQEILERLTALEEGQSIALDVGATQTMEIQDILQGILDAILAGDLTATAEVVDTAELPVDPEEPVVPLPPEGLDELGAALTSRFPFSIPWDVYKGIQLLAAPAKAPYFEVDFLAPIAHWVGGWKGSTKIVLDFTEYEIIGQVCRWTSTIGFCLMLAGGTKRLIWTA